MRQHIGRILQTSLHLVKQELPSNTGLCAEVPARSKVYGNERLSVNTASKPLAEFQIEDGNEVQKYSYSHI